LLANRPSRAPRAPGYLAPLRKALIEDDRRHINLVVYEEDYRALKWGVENLLPGVQ
jgi:hypothetical protein